MTVLVGQRNSVIGHSPSIPYLLSISFLGIHFLFKLKLHYLFITQALISSRKFSLLLFLSILVNLFILFLIFFLFAMPLKKGLKMEWKG